MAMKVFIDAVSQHSEHEFYIADRIRKFASKKPALIFTHKNYTVTFDGIKQCKLSVYGWISFYFSVFRARNVEFLAVNPKIMVLCTFLRLLKIEVTIHPHAYGETICNNAFKYHFFWNAFFFLNGKILVNSRGIKRRFFELKSIPPNLVHNISHPLYPFDKKEANKERTNKDSKPIIRFVGTAHENKGISFFLELAEKFSDVYSFYVNTTAAEDFGINKAWVSEVEYRALLVQSDLIYCLYPETSYNLYASGTVLDAVSAQTPLVTSDFAFARDIFHKYSDNFIFSKKELEELLTDSLGFSTHLESTRPLLKNVKSDWLRQSLEDA